MRRFKYLSYLTCLFVVGVLTACGDEFLERPPQDRIVDANFYQTDEQILSGTAPLYNIVWFAYNDKASHGIGDGRGGLLSSGSYQMENIRLNTTGTTAENLSAWSAFYNVVGQSNTVISNINAYAGEEVSEEMMNHGIAEARFMRGMAYYYLVQNWGPVPIIEQNQTLLSDTTIARNTVESVWQFIIKDFRFAAENLPESPVAEGRLTQWSAEGMLAKSYLTYAGVIGSGTRDQNALDSAAYFAEDVIRNSGKTLLPDYGDLFLLINNNNEESLFSLQWVYNGSEWGSQNSVQAFLAYGSEITGFSDGWGGDIGASRYILSLYAQDSEPYLDPSTPVENIPNVSIEAEGMDERLKPSFMLPASHYPEITQCPPGQDCHELVVPVQSTAANDAEVRPGEEYNSRVWVKKYIIGRPEDNGGRVQQQRTEIGTYMLRLADVYLIYAEALLGNDAVTSNSDALTYFNRVRTRAGLDPVTSFTYMDLLHERLKEFAMEGQAWYDFVRLHYYDPQLAYDLLSKQYRGFYRAFPTEFEERTIDGQTFDVAIAWEIVAEEDEQPDFFPASPANFFLPVPATELSSAPNLRKEPVPYNFSRGGE